MKFRTVFKPHPSDLKLNIDRPILFFGSCFAEYICDRSRQSMWNCNNLGGTLFNPISIEYALQILLLEEEESTLNRMIKDSLIFHDDVWHSLLFDSSCSGTEKDAVVKRIKERRREAMKIMNEGANLVITFGTAWTYALVSDIAGMTGKVVGNCHKLPACLFERRLLRPEEIVEVWIKIIDKIRAVWPKTNIIFSLSPVRHIKDGLDGNSLSKSILRYSISQILEKTESTIESQIQYFPAYEIILDDLRDYRFFETDLVHPSEMAVEYVWENFLATFVDSCDQQLLKEGENIGKGMRHRTLIKNVVVEQANRDKLQARIEALREKWPQSLLGREG